MTILIAPEVRKILELEGQALLDASQAITTSPLQQASIEQAVELIEKTLSQGGKIIVTGVGKSGKIAEKIAATLSSTGSLALFLHPTEGLHGDLGLLTENDVILALSYTGNTEEILRLLPSFRARKAPLIALVGNANSALAQAAQVTISASVKEEACPHNLAPTTSTTLALAYGDAIAVTLMKRRGFQPEDFARNHPGGSIGKKLTLNVSDLMHTGSALPLVLPEALMEEVVIASTAKKLGAVLVVDALPGKSLAAPKLIGILTDGDIRRALSHKERFFSLKASEVMTARPLTVLADERATQALKVMQERESQINVLPVVTLQQEVVGLVRLHDLVRAF